MQYSIYQNDPATILVNPNSTIDDILTTNLNSSIFIFPSGNYYIIDILNINRPYIKFSGLTKNPKDVHIFQINDKDGINVISNNFVMEYISIHVTTNDKVSLIVANSSNNNIQNCYFYGNETTFTIYFAGPKTLSVGSSTLDGYYNNILDMNNVFSNNVIYSKWSGDCVSFSLQLNGKVNSNIIRGGKLSVYMCKSCEINKNIIYDSINHGIHISLPSNDVNIINNKIYECDASGIKLNNQIEHGSFTGTLYNINIKNNYIYDSKTNAIELNDVMKCNIQGNKLISSSTYGIYLLRSNKVNISKNKVSYFDVAIWLEACNNNNIIENNFMSIYPDEGKNIVKLSVDSNNNKITDNISKGRIIYDKYIIPVETRENQLNNNIHYEYYDISNEINVIK